jgi:hypothetical protein
MRSYVNWQQEAQDHFMHWAKLGWQANQQANQISQDMFMPGMSWWGGASSSPANPYKPGKPAPPQTLVHESQTELDALKAKLAKVEADLSQALQSGTPQVESVKKASRRKSKA